MCAISSRYSPEYCGRSKPRGNSPRWADTRAAPGSCPHTQGSKARGSPALLGATTAEVGTPYGKALRWCVSWSTHSIGDKAGTHCSRAGCKVHSTAAAGRSSWCRLNQRCISQVAGDRTCAHCRCKHLVAGYRRNNC